MYKSILLLASCLSLSIISIAQSNSIKTLFIKPSLTDERIKLADTPHLVMYQIDKKPSHLLLFMPGTNGLSTSKGPQKFLNTAIEQGYRVINLSYINKDAGAVICFNERAKDSDCIEKFRIKRIYGNNVTNIITDEPQDCIINRFTKLIQYLAKTDKTGNWDYYLKNKEIDWSKIALSGQSQGGGMATFMAKKLLVARVISFSGGWDYAAANQIAKWYFYPSTTPTERWYATYHTEEPKAKTIAEAADAMRIPKSHIFVFDKPVPTGAKAHGNGINNILYQPIWRIMLGRGDINLHKKPLLY